MHWLYGRWVARKKVLSSAKKRELLCRAYFVDQLFNMSKVERDYFYEANIEKLNKLTSIYAQQVVSQPEIVGDFYDHWLSINALSQAIEVSNHANYRKQSALCGI